jgi:hypothetical protein
MELKEILSDDLEEVFFDDSEFTEEIIHKLEDSEETLMALFDAKSELIFEGATEFGESVALVPSIVLKSRDAKKINSDSILIVDINSYRMLYRHREDRDITRIFLEKIR